SDLKQKSILVYGLYEPWTKVPMHFHGCTYYRARDGFELHDLTKAFLNPFNPLNPWLPFSLSLHSAIWFVDFSVENVTFLLPKANYTDRPRPCIVSRVMRYPIIRQ